MKAIYLLKIGMQVNWDEKYLTQVRRLTQVRFLTSYKQLLKSKLHLGSFRKFCIIRYTSSVFCVTQYFYLSVILVSFFVLHNVVVNVGRNSCFLASTSLTYAIAMSNLFLILKDLFIEIVTEQTTKPFIFFLYHTKLQCL